MILDDTDQSLLELLRINSRASTSKLARELGLSRTTVTSRIERLEQKGIISGYTVRLNEQIENSLIQAHVMISSDPKHAASIVKKLEKISAVRALHAVNGMFELLAIVTNNSTQQLDQVLDEIGIIEGIQKTTSSIILSTKFSR